jgi:hypothetical protein
MSFIPFHYLSLINSFVWVGTPKTPLSPMSPMSQSTTTPVIPIGGGIASPPASTTAPSANGTPLPGSVVQHPSSHDGKTASSSTRAKLSDGHAPVAVKKDGRMKKVKLSRTPIKSRAIPAADLEVVELEGTGFGERKW